SCMTHAGSRNAGSMTCALVMMKPRPSTNQPVPVSRNGGGVTVVGPRPQFSVTSAPTSAVMSTTAGFTRRMASWTDSASIGVGADQAWHGAVACSVTAGSGGATLWRWELIRGAGAAEDSHAGTTRVLLEHAIDLDQGGEYLMRADRVDFAPGGVALPHRHRGGGIRCLVAGTLDVTVGDRPARRIAPGGAWFESGREPVLAVASKDDATSFIRVAIL